MSINANETAGPCPSREPHPPLSQPEQGRKQYQYSSNRKVIQISLLLYRLITPSLVPLSSPFPSHAVQLDQGIIRYLAAFHLAPHIIQASLVC